MSTDTVKALTSLHLNGRILLALHKLLPHLKKFVLQSRFIETASKDGIIADLDKLNTTLRDAYRCSLGKVPYTKRQLKKQKEMQCQLFPMSCHSKKKPAV